MCLSVCSIVSLSVPPSLCLSVALGDKRDASEAERRETPKGKGEDAVLHRSQIEIQQKRSARLDPISAPFVALPLEDNAKKQLTHKRTHKQAIIKVEIAGAKIAGGAGGGGAWQRQMQSLCVHKFLYAYTIYTHTYVCKWLCVCVCAILRKDSQREHSLNGTWDDAGGHAMR